MSQVTTSQIKPSQITISQIARINSQCQIVIGQVATTQIATIFDLQYSVTSSSTQPIKALRVEGIKPRNPVEVKTPSRNPKSLLNPSSTK